MSTIGSDGKINLYDLAVLSGSSESVSTYSPIATYDTKGSRLTSLAMAADVAPTNGKRRRGEDDSDTEEDDDDDDAEEGEDLEESDSDNDSNRAGQVEGEEDGWGGLSDDGEE